MSYCHELTCFQLAPCSVHGAATPSSKLFTFGVISDIQYCDRDDGHNYDRTVVRRYRHALNSVNRAVEEWRAEGLAFVGQLGDIIDGQASKGKQSERALRRVMEAFNELERAEEKAAHPFFVHAVGNHELYNFTRDELRKALPMPTEAADPCLSYHSFSPSPGWRVVVADAFDIAITGWPVDDPRHIQAHELLRKNNPNDLGSGDWSVGLSGTNKRWMPYNGAFAPEQVRWFASTLDKAQKAGERVIVLSHVPVCPGASDLLTLLWNYEEVLSLIHASNSVVAVITGHDHDGGYIQDAKGVHHVTLQSPLECDAGSVAFGSIDVFHDRLELRGRGTVPSRTMPFANTN